MTENDPDVFLTVRKLGMVSMTEVLKDIIPGYRIRLPTEAKKAAKVITQFPENYTENRYHTHKTKYCSLFTYN